MFWEWLRKVVERKGDEGDDGVSVVRAGLRGNAD